MKRKMFAVLLTVAVLLSLVSTTAYAARTCPNCGEILAYEGTHTISTSNYRWVPHYDSNGRYLHEDMYYDELRGRDYRCPRCLIVHCYPYTVTRVEHDSPGTGK